MSVPIRPIRYEGSFTIKANTLFVHSTESEQPSHLFRREDGDVVLVDDPGLLLYHTLICLFPELVARQPEEHVLLAEFGAQKLSKRVPSRRTAHQLVEGLAPGAHLLQRGLRAAGGNTGTVGMRDFIVLHSGFPVRVKSTYQSSQSAVPSLTS